MKNQRKYLMFWIGVLILSIFMAVSCEKEPIYDPDCGIVEVKEWNDPTWTVTYLWNDGSWETIIWHFDIVSQVGDTVCKLKEIDINELNCKP